MLLPWKYLLSKKCHFYTSTCLVNCLSWFSFSNFYMTFSVSIQFKCNHIEEGHPKSITSKFGLICPSGSQEDQNVKIEWTTDAK